MMTGGRVLHHLKSYLSDEKSGVLIIGYQAEGTLGRKIFDGVSPIHIHQEPITVRAEICAIGAFSAHADRNKMARWLLATTGEIKDVFLVHGDIQVKREFKVYLEEKISAAVHIPQANNAFDI